MDTLTFWEMHLSDVLLGVSSVMSVWSSGENRATETEARGGGYRSDGKFISPKIYNS